MDLTHGEVQDFVSIIRDIVRQELSNNNNVEYVYYGKVKTVNTDGTYDVEIPSDGGTYPSLLNKTGEVLQVGNSVTIRARNRNMGNAYIGLKNGTIGGGGGGQTVQADWNVNDINSPSYIKNKPFIPQIVSASSNDYFPPSGDSRNLYINTTSNDIYRWDNTLGKYILLDSDSDSDSDVYSTDEIQIGYYNNKPLYRKVFTGITVSNTTSPVEYADLSSLNIDKCISIKGGIYPSGTTIPWGYASIIEGTSYHANVWIRNNNSKLTILTSTSWGSVTYIAILEYTKTTD